MLLMSVISTDSEGAKRPKGSGEIPRMRPRPCRYEVFSPSCPCYPLPDARRTSIQVLGLHSLKRWRREKKIALIKKINPRWADLAENWGCEMRFRGQSLGRTP